MESRRCRTWLIVVAACGLFTRCDLMAPGPPAEAFEYAFTGAAGAVLVGAGDIADCDSNAHLETARLLDQIAGTVFTTGDNAYRDGAAEEYRNCYSRSWGRHAHRTRPALGNHGYHASSTAGPFYDYFGDNAGPRGRGYYSFDLGGWHVIVLDSNAPIDEGAPQIEWLRADLAANPTPCALAYWHHPRFSSGHHGNHPHMTTAWRVLDEAGVDVALAGHDHDYERFSPQNAEGVADSDGIRQFVVGTGGAKLRRFRTIEPNSEIRDRRSHGVLALWLGDGEYEWQFVPEPRSGFRDRGRASCGDSTAEVTRVE